MMNRRVMTMSLVALTSFGAASCAVYRDGDYVTAAMRQFSLVLIPRSLPADGASTTMVEFHSSAGATDEGQSVTITASSGSWRGATGASVSVPMDHSGVARAILQAGGVPATAYLTAVMSGQVTVDSVTLVRAHAESVDVAPSAYILKVASGAELAIGIALRRRSGVVTAGELVTLSALDSTGTRVGAFSPVAPSDATGSTSVRFVPGSTQYRGNVRVVASVDTGSVQPVSGSAVVVLISP
jgi:hypothetical protein